MIFGEELLAGSNSNTSKFMLTVPMTSKLSPVKVQAPEEDILVMHAVAKVRKTATFPHQLTLGSKAP